MKNFLIRFAGFIIIALTALPLYACTVNALVYLGMTTTGIADGFGNDMTMKAMFVWMGCLLLGGIAIFIQKGWAKIFYFSPLYAPSLFAVAYTIVQN